MATLVVPGRAWGQLPSVCTWRASVSPSTPRDTGVPGGVGVCCPVASLVGSSWPHLGPGRKEASGSIHHTATGPPLRHLEGGRVVQWPPWGLESRPAFRSPCLCRRSPAGSQSPSSWETGVWPRADLSSSWAGRGVSGPFTRGFLGRRLNPSLLWGLLLVRTQKWDVRLEQMSEVLGGALRVHHETWADLCVRRHLESGWPRAGSLGEGRGCPLLLPGAVRAAGSGKQTGMSAGTVARREPRAGGPRGRV